MVRLYLQFFVGGLMSICVFCVCLRIVMSIICLYVLSSVLWCSLRFPHKNWCLVRLYLQLFAGGLMLYKCINVIFACLHIVVSNTYWLYEKHDRFLIKEAGTACPSRGTWVHSWLLVGSVLLIFIIFCVLFFASFVFILCLMYPMLPVSLDCPSLIPPLFFSNVYFLLKTGFY